MLWFKLYFHFTLFYLRSINITWHKEKHRSKLLDIFNQRKIWTTNHASHCQMFKIWLNLCLLAELFKWFFVCIIFCHVQMALSAGTPILRGYLSDLDCRWCVIAGAVDDRTPEERGQEVLVCPSLVWRKVYHELFSPIIIIIIIIIINNNNNNNNNIACKNATEQFSLCWLFYFLIHCNNSQVSTCIKS